MSKESDTELSDNESYKSEEMEDEVDINDTIDILDVAEEEDDDFNFGKKEIIVSKEDRITRPFMTKYELVRVIGTRRKQLSLGAKPLIKVDGKLSINEIVNEEVKHKMIPFKIKRPLMEANKYEIWDFNELDFSHLLDILD